MSCEVLQICDAVGGQLHEPKLTFDLYNVAVTTLDQDTVFTFFQYSNWWSLLSRH